MFWPLRGITCTYMLRVVLTKGVGLYYRHVSYLWAHTNTKYVLGVFWLRM